MPFNEILLLAVALAMDAFAVSVGTGCALRRVDGGQYVRMSGAFGFFQFFMPVIGWYLGLTVQGFIQEWDHWVAFGLLMWIGGSMVRESFSKDDDEDENGCPPLASDPTRGKQLLVLSVATSIDALAVGLSFAMLQQSVWVPSLTIGVVCAALTAAGLFLGQRLARAALIGRRAELLGGAVLLLIGIRILYDHQVF